MIDREVRCGYIELCLAFRIRHPSYHVRSILQALQKIRIILALEELLL